MRRGFNVFQLIIVVTILVVLIALLLPGVQKVREEASRMKCANNLKQIALACHNSASANNDHFPPGTIPNPELAPEQRLSFLVTLLPYLECGPRAGFVETESWDSPQNQSAAKAELRGRVYSCLSWVGGPNAPAASFGVITNYVGVAGVGADAATRPAKAPGIGIFGYDRTIAFKDIPDGTANTAMLLETGFEVGPWVRGGSGTVRPIDDAQFGGTHTEPSRLFSKPGNSFNIALADGSVRLATAEIDSAVLAALATVAGREEIPANW